VATALLVVGLIVTWWIPEQIDSVSIQMQVASLRLIPINTRHVTTILSKLSEQRWPKGTQEVVTALTTSPPG